MFRFFRARPVFLPALLLCAALVSGCGPKEVDITVPGLADAEICDDLALLPQDLTVFADKVGRDVRLITPEEQEEENRRFDAKFFGPWRATRASLPLRDVMEAVRNLNPNRGFIENLRPFPQERWTELVANCNARAYVANGPVRHGITVMNVDMRRMPTNLPFFRNPSQPGEGYPFDYFQATSLWLGTPVAITHVSSDAMWIHIETGIAYGWVPAQSVAVVDSAFRARWETTRLGAVTRDNTTLAVIHKEDTTGRNRMYDVSVGTILPFSGKPYKAPQTGVLVPVRDTDGKALIREGAVPLRAFAAKPLPMTPGYMAAVGNSMMGQPYGWGGLHGQRDCSALTKDMFAPFGVWMPRNSRRQNVYGTVFDVSKLDPEEKERRIIAQGTPFLSLVAMPGHVGVYLGTHEFKGKEVPVMFHNFWGLRINPDANAAADSGEEPPSRRAVIGKAVVTTLRPGAEKPGIASPNSLLDRITGLSTMPGRR